MKCIVLAAACVLLACSFVHAQSGLLLVDFNGYAPGDSTNNAAVTYAGSGILGSDIWNGLQVSNSQPNTIVAYYPSSTGLVCTDGTVASGISISLSGFTGANATTGLTGGLLYGDFLVGSNSSITISGLIPYRTYDLCCYSSSGDPTASNRVGAAWTANGVGPLNLFRGGPSQGTLSNVPADAAGAIVIQITPDTVAGSVSIVNGFEVRPTPDTNCVVTLEQDLNFDCVVDFKDYAVLGRWWLEIDYNAIDVFCEQWLKCTKTSCPNCLTNPELLMARQRVTQWFASEYPTPPILFTYNGVSSNAFLRTWNFARTKTELDPNRTQWTLVYTQPSNGPLRVTCQVIEYHDYPAVEWTVYFKNIGTSNTPILKGIQGLNTFFQRSNESEFILNGIKGDWTAAESFQPYQITLGMNAVKNFTPSDHLGKSTSGPDGWPYFNLQMPGSGVIMAVGWPGQWASSFSRDASNGLRITAGQQLTNLYLKPGEEIRTPLIAMLFWQGTDVVRAQNLWRRWYIAHTLPRINGQPQQPITHIGGDNINVANAYRYYGIYPDVLWRDAGWYKNNNSPYTGGDAWLNTGTWEINPAMYPNGFRPVSDQLHAVGMKFLLWFEPERVGDLNSWLGINHPEWLLQPGSVGLILNEGNPAALNWLINHVDGMIKSEGIDWYREDMNGGGPCTSWRNNDAGDRQGITENFYVQGHLAFWDELRRRNPNLRIDSCASGGRRNDLETMRRAVPLTRSDFMFRTMTGVVEGNQGHTYGLSSWLPFQGSGCFFYDAYSFRSFYLSSFGMAEGIGGSNIAAQQKAYAECRQIAPSMLFGDYYPLTPYSLQLDQWIAWQFHRSELGVGVVQAFRRANSAVTIMTFKLQGLEPGTIYTVKNFDGGTSTKTGSELMNTGLTVDIPVAPGSATINYVKN